MIQVTPAYAAGLLDGEGHVAVRVNAGRGFRVPSLQVAFQMTLPAKPLLETLHKQHGGSLCLGYEAKGNWNETWIWSMGGSTAADFLRVIQPHVVIKAEQVRLALLVEDMRLKQRMVGKRRFWSEEDREKVFWMVGRIKEMNRKGPTPEPPPGTTGMVARYAAGTWVTDQSDMFSELGYQEFSGTFPASGSMRGGVVYEHPILVPPISVNASSSSDGTLPCCEASFIAALLPTPHANCHTGPGTHGDGGENLQTAVEIINGREAVVQDVVPDL